MTKGLLYSHTNESLDAIVAGLNVRGNDTILAIAGSGDQAFALLEKARKVIAVDENPAQIELVRKRAELLRKGNYHEFLHDDVVGECDGFFLFRDKDAESLTEFNRITRKKYFSREDRIGKIKRRMDRLEILEPTDIQIAVAEHTFSKVYLSNVLPSINSFESISRKLPKNGLVYVSERYGFHIPKEMILDEELTRLARVLESRWGPTVYRVTEGVAGGNEK